MDSQIRLYYVTCPDKKTAHSIAKTMLEEGLIGCANILPGMESMYFWEGKQETANEVVLILKSADLQTDRIISRVESLHPYNTPCILVLPIEKGSEPYIRWLKGNLY